MQNEVDQLIEELRPQLERAIAFEGSVDGNPRIWMRVIELLADYREKEKDHEQFLADRAAEEEAEYDARLLAYEDDEPPF